MTGNEHITQEDLALHALQILSAEDSTAVCSHLAQCAFCRDELAEISGDTAMVGLSVPQNPVPADARLRFLNRIAADAAATKPSVPPEARDHVLSSRRNIWIPWATAAALATIAIALGVKNYTLDQELRNASLRVSDLTDQSGQARRVLEVLTSHSSQVVLLTASKTAVEPTGRAVYRADSGSLVFQANNLKPLASDKTYELWVIPANGKPIPAGLFRPDAAGSSSVVMPPIPKGVPAKAFGVTIEGAQGSDTPTPPIILSGATTLAAGE
jgi:anti-sigma-K factor RskA